MATIRTVVQVQDNMSRAFQSMNNAMNIVISSFEELQRQSSNAVDTSSIQAARQELNNAEIAFNQIEQEIIQADQAQQHLNNTIHGGTNAASGFLNKIAGVVAAYLSFQSAKGVIALSDEMTNTTARLDMMNDGLQTTAELQQMIFDSAQRSYGAYSQTADLVAKLGMNAKDAFGSNAETVAFAELLNKQFGIAGTNAEGVSAATLQLTQALGSGVLRGQELNSIFEQAPNIIQTVADYLEVPIGKIREMAADGEITAEIVKRSMFEAADDINAKFASMPLTFEQIWTSFKNEALWAFQPVLQKINEIANNEKFLDAINSISNSIQILSSIAFSTMSVLMTIGGFLYDNWSLISPVVGTATAAIVAYTSALLILKAASVVQAFWLGIKTLALGLYTASTWASVQATIAATGAAWGLNAALYANPIFLVVMALVALIGILYLAVAVINKFAGTSISATGIVAGAFMVLVTFIYNRFAFLWNIFASIAEFFVNVWNHPMYSVKRLFANLTNNVLDQAIAMTKGWDGFATNFVNAIIWAVNQAIGAWNKFIDLLPDSVTGALGLGKGTEFSYRASITSDLSNMKANLDKWVGETPADYWEAPKMEIKPLDDAWDAGYNWGANLFNKDNEGKEEGKNPWEELLSNAGAFDELDKNGADTAANTAKMAKSMEASEEDLKYLRDLAERDVINRFTTAEVKVDMTNHNTVNSDLDLDGIIDQFGEKLEETLDVIAEGAN